MKKKKGTRAGAKATVQSAAIMELKVAVTLKEVIPTRKVWTRDSNPSLGSENALSYPQEFTCRKQRMQSEQKMGGEKKELESFNP